MGDRLGTARVVACCRFFVLFVSHYTSQCTPHQTRTATPKFTMTPTDMTLVYGNTATISCAFNGYPNPSVVWRRDRENVVSDDRTKITSCATSSILEVIRLQYEDAGIYTCYITNQQGSNSASMMLSIHGRSCDCHVPNM